MSGGMSRSSSSGAASGSRPLFPTVLRQDLAPTAQVTAGPQFPSTSSPDAGFVGQGASLMALGHNVMFPGAKLMTGSAHEAHRYMAEAYRLAAGDHEAHRLPYSASGSASQSLLSETHRTTPDVSPAPAAAGSLRQAQTDRASFSAVEMASHLNLDSGRVESHSSRVAPSVERLPHNISRQATSKSDSENLQFSKNTYTTSASSVSQIAPQTSKSKSIPSSAASGASMFPMPFPSAYQQYSEESNFKRQYFDESFAARREAVTASGSNAPDTSPENRERNDGDTAGSSHLNRFDNQCSNQELFNREEMSRSGSRHDDIGSDLSFLAQATTSAHSELMRSKLARGRQGKEYKCNSCDMEFKNGTQLKNHTWRHSGEKPHACTVCQATFTQLSNLKTHMRIHTGERPYACQECNATFTQISNLRTHQKTHTGEKPYECDVCFSRFSQQSNLKSHKLIHSGERPFKCDECGATFVQSTHLRNHKRIHTNERPYACEQCGAKFRQLSNLKTHEKIHTGERPHTCEECGSTFAQKSNLKSHMLKLHAHDGAIPNKRGRKKKLEAIRPFSCEECGAKFTMMSNLRIHMRLHTGEKPFQCDTCGASFAQKSNLKTHEQIHSEERPFKCSECPAAFRQNTNLKTHKMKKHPVKSLKIKILQDSHYTMHDMPHAVEGEGAPASHLIGEPIVQIREGKGEQFHLLGSNTVEGGELIKLEGEMYGRQDNAFCRSNEIASDHCPSEMNPYDSSNF